MSFPTFLKSWMAAYGSQGWVHTAQNPFPSGQTVVCPNSITALSYIPTPWPPPGIHTRLTCSACWCLWGSTFLLEPSVFRVWIGTDDLNTWKDSPFSPIYAQSYLCSEKHHWPVTPQRVEKSYLGELGMGPVTGFAPIWQTAIKPLLTGHWMYAAGGGEGWQ